uniref:V-set and transmembrane domain-containing protein 5 n=1 Tax=Bos taurus TaxID=9913 RepID=A0AAA9T290_BOVIN
MRPPPGGRTRRRGLSLGVLALCVAAARCLQSQGVSLYIPQPAINATVEEDILLSVDYSCHGIPTIEWKYTSSWGVQKIVEWKPGTQANISQSHKDRVCTFDNGSIQLFSVGVRDSGSYIVTVTERLGSSRFGTIVLHVSAVTYGCEIWTTKQAECRRTDAFELWCWRRLLRVPWIARRSNQSILKEISPGCSLEGLMLKLKLQYFGHLM